MQGSFDRPLVLAAALALATAPTAAHEAHRHDRAPPGADAWKADIKLVEATLLSQRGDKLKFPGEALGGRIVVMDFIYTNCTTVCPVVSALFAQLQDRLGSSLGEEVSLVTITVDPARDTPQRLRDYAARFDARPGWLWLTGEKGAVDQVLKGLGTYTPDFTRHPSVILVGDAGRGTWRRLYGLPGVEEVIAQVEALRAARRQAAAAAKGG
ncbi:MAG: SCO family protein [Pseudomonadota bacterium]